MYRVKLVDHQLGMLRAQWIQARVRNAIFRQVAPGGPRLDITRVKAVAKSGRVVDSGEIYIFIPEDLDLWLVNEAPTHRLWVRRRRNRGSLLLDFACRDDLTIFDLKFASRLPYQILRADDDGLQVESELDD